MRLIQKYYNSVLILVSIISSQLKPLSTIELCDTSFMENQTIGYGVENNFHFYPWRSFEPENGRTEYIEIIGKNVKCFCKSLFFPRNVREAIFVDLGVEYIEPRFFENTAVEQVNLRGNHLQQIKSNIFSNTTIRSLILEDNLIEFIAPNAFDDMPKLEAISLDNNRLTQWDIRWFKNAQSLYEVSIKFNFLSVIPGDLTLNWYHGIPFNYPTYYVLGSLNFDNNLIETIDPGAFKNISVVDVISLRNNKLTNVPEGVFKHFQYLLELNLSGNKVVCLDNNTVKSLESVRKLFLEGNPINLDCGADIQRFFENMSHIAYF